MLSAITLGLSALQLLVAITVLGLSASVASQSTYDPRTKMSWHKVSNSWIVTLRFCIFLGVYGIVSAIVTIVSLLVAAVSTIIPLLLNIIGALLFLAGGIAWAINFRKLEGSCSDASKVLKLYGFSNSFAASAASACRRCAADEGLIFTLSALSVGLAVCTFLHRRSLKQSSKF